MRTIHKFAYVNTDNYAYDVCLRIDATTGDWNISPLHVVNIPDLTVGGIIAAGNKADIKWGVKRYLNLIDVTLYRQGLTLRREYRTYLKTILLEKIKK